MDDFYYDGEWWSESDFIPPDGGGSDDDRIQSMDLSEPELRQWVLDNPNRVEEPDVNGNTPLEVAVELDCWDLVQWLLDGERSICQSCGTRWLHAFARCDFP
jgi:hypothetical protein